MEPNTVALYRADVDAAQGEGAEEPHREDAVGLVQREERAEDREEQQPQRRASQARLRVRGAEKVIERSAAARGVAL